jgi:hypothetical protein
MRDTVYDTSFVVYSNGDLAGRRASNVLDRRLAKIEEFLVGSRVAWYNDKLFGEYQSKIKVSRNDVIEAFLIRLVDAGRRVARSTLSATNYARAREARWPGHDQHVLAAAVVGTRTTVFVTEKALSDCAGSVEREFGVKVVRIA